MAMATSYIVYKYIHICIFINFFITDIMLAKSHGIHSF